MEAAALCIKRRETDAIPQLPKYKSAVISAVCEPVVVEAEFPRDSRIKRHRILGGRLHHVLDGARIYPPGELS